MIVIPVTEGESVERAIKRYKRKFEKTGILKELRNRKEYKKPSIIRRTQKLKAAYIQKIKDKSF
ncbi:MAG TPA: 30S ribosomal protein S21 [Bacteroidales bacterium]|nr:30S ribosomal protein S21 [Bacteroidales bacterium]